MKEDNQAVIKALNMYGRVPKMWELLKEIERLNNIINELEKYLIKIRETSTPQEHIMAKFVLEYIKILKGEELDDVRPYDELDEILELERDNLELKGSDKE